MRFIKILLVLTTLTATQSVTVSNRQAIQTTQCSTFEWQCDSGQCIDSSEACDGVRNCRDGSDETTENCISVTCPRNAFRCMYGGCVSGRAECNHNTECIDGSDEATSKCPTKTEEQLRGQCGLMSFQCDNGECIGMDFLCDGNAECSDFSDENVKYCAATHCPSYAFRCGNGACISGKKKCDLRIDCTDASDENYLLCGRRKDEQPQMVSNVRPRPPSRPTQQQQPSPTHGSSSTSSPSIPNSYNNNHNNNQNADRNNQHSPASSALQSCRADVIPTNGDAYFQFDTHKKVEYGEIVENFISINYKCIENHYLIGNATNICINGRWQSSKPQCRPRCNPQEIQGVTISANCFSIVNNVQKSTSCIRPVEPGTIAYVSCQRGYEKTGPQQTLTCQPNGRWNPPPQRCTSICGEINAGSAYVVGGATTNITRVPWHAAIYKKNGYDSKFQQICGATIVSSKIVISAMHCFWDRSEDQPFRPEMFQVAVGKTYRDYAAREEYKPQFFGVEQILFIEGYNDLAGYYSDDIALLVLDKHIEFHSFIVPICLPQNLQYEEKAVPVGWVGVTAGWGLEQSNGLPSSILKKIDLPVVSREECKEKSSPEFANFITSDKFCAGYLTGVAVCQGDSGGGLVFPHTVRQKTTYFLRGIVSTGGNKDGSCDNDKYTTFTNVAFHMDFVNTHITKYEPKY